MKPERQCDEDLTVSCNYWNGPCDQCGGVCAEQQPKFAANAPDSILTPDLVKTERLGDLNFFDGLPSEETVEKVYDYLDTARRRCVPERYASGLHLRLLGGHEGSGDGHVPVLGITEGLIDARTLLLTPNTTTIYCIAEINVKDGPTVMEIPPGVLGPVDDAYFRWVTDVGQTGPDQGKGGKYLFLPPGYQGNTPEGYFVGRTRTLRQLASHARLRD